MRLRPARHAAVLIAALAMASPATAQDTPAKVAAPAPATAQATPDAGPGALSDVFLGKDDAPVTVVEYASLTCSHCAAFHKETWPILKSRYVDTGKVRFALRPFPLDNLAVAAAMLARCRDDASYYPTVDLLFSNQAEWAFSSKPADALQAMAKRAGFSDGQFESCLKEQRLLDGVVASRTNAAKDSKVAATPSLIVNGVLHAGGLTPEGLDAVLEPLLKNFSVSKD